MASVPDPSWDIPAEPPELPIMMHGTSVANGSAPQSSVARSAPDLRTLWP
ncbi:hypothetical protein GCM10022205_01490 [Spinactinospora alkalitolerans]